MKLAQIKNLLLENDEDNEDEEDLRPSEAEAKETFYEMWDDIVTEKVTQFVENHLPVLILESVLFERGTKVTIGNGQALIDLCRLLARGGEDEEAVFASFDGIDLHADTENKAAFQADITMSAFYYISNSVWDFLDNNCSVKECLMKLGHYGHNAYYQFSAGYDSISQMRNNAKFNIVRSIKFDNLCMETGANIPLRGLQEAGVGMEGAIAIIGSPTFKGEKILIECSGTSVLVVFAQDDTPDANNIEFSFSPKISIGVQSIQDAPDVFAAPLLDLGFPREIDSIMFNSGVGGAEWVGGISPKRVANWDDIALNYPKLGAPTNPMDILSKFSDSTEFDNLLRYIANNQSKAMININLLSEAKGKIFLSAFRYFYHFLLLVEHKSIKVYSDNGFADVITEMAQQLGADGISEYEMEDWMEEYQHLWEDYITLG